MNIQQIDRYCDLYERRLKGGAHVTAQQFLDEHDLPAEDRLVPELHRLEREYLHDSVAVSTANPPCKSFDVNRRTDSMVGEEVGGFIGSYKLLQKIGEGGMGMVYMAEQTRPITRRVALKVIKPGMDSREVLARFEAERQALALMNHAHIAAVLDAGTTETGRPYFVMELVKGVPITRYCDQKHLTPIERIQLFLPICQAVQHAHQKGVIHRDLKPSNVLVAEYDGRPIPKIIDFGVAKAISQKLTERTMFTQYGQIVGTLDYMSPEQASFNQLDVDTRTDIYSLGVLLYELLAGDTPFDRKRLRAAAFEELLRIIRQEEPPRPSLRLSSHADLPGIAANRGTDPRRLSLFVRGDLDWIVMKAMDKERNRRYPTATGLAEDICRYLQHEPVQARPPSASYRFWKFARRNRVALGAAATVVGALFVGLSGTSWALVAERQAAAAEVVAVNANAQADRESSRVTTNSRVQLYQSETLVQFEEMMRASMNQVTAQMQRDPGLNSPESQLARQALFEIVTDFWDKAIAYDVDQNDGPGSRNRRFRLLRALCLARAGDLQQAFTDARVLRKDPGDVDPHAEDLIRIFAICAAGNQELRQESVACAVDVMRQAADLNASAPPDLDDPDFASLQSREEVQEILDDWLVRWNERVSRAEAN